jgi:hypothetical protein
VEHARDLLTTTWKTALMNIPSVGLKALRNPAELMIVSVNSQPLHPPHGTKVRSDSDIPAPDMTRSSGDGLIYDAYSVYGDIIPCGDGKNRWRPVVFRLAKATGRGVSLTTQWLPKPDIQLMRRWQYRTAMLAIRSTIPASRLQSCRSQRRRWCTLQQRRPDVEEL